MQGNFGEKVRFQECNLCKQEIEVGWKYCPNCKVKISSCVNCGNVLDKNWKFCPHCKSNLSEIKTSYESSNEWLASILKDK